MHRRHAIMLLLCVMLGGCAWGIASPFPASESTPIRDLAPYVPEQFLAGTRDVLVLTQHATEKRKQGLWTMDMEMYNTWVTTMTVQARVLKSGQLSELTRDLNLSSESRIDSIRLLTARGTGVFQFAKVSGEKLEKLCLLNADGWETMFRPIADGWDAGPRKSYAANRRDAVVAALRAGREDPFAAGEGPCEITGNIDWPGDVRSRVIEFLARPR